MGGIGGAFPWEGLSFSTLVLITLLFLLIGDSK